MSDPTKRQRLPIVRASASHAPGGIATVQLDSLDALQAGQTMRSMARDRRSFMPQGTRDLFTRLGSQLTAPALLVMKDGAR